MTLAAKENTLEKMRARGTSACSKAPHNVTGGATLDYTRGRGVRRERRWDDAGRRESRETTRTVGSVSGKMLTFYKGKSA